MNNEKTNLQQQKFIRMTTTPVQKLVLRLSVPTIASMLVTALYNVADTFFVSSIGGYAGTCAIAAVSVSLSVMALIQALGFFVGQGAANFISRALGRHEVDKASEMAATGLFLALTLGAGVTLLGELYTAPVARFLGADEEYIDQRVRKTAAILGLTDYLDRLPRALSGGQRQRVAIGRAIIRKVGVFLMDEPLSNLDAKQRVTMRSEITQIHRETGATTIYVTHDQTEAMTMADRIVVMKDGYVQQIGTPYELYFKPVNVFVAGFIGEPPMNFIREKVENGAISVGGKKLDLQHKLGGRVKEYEGKEIVFGFRPESIRLGEAEKSYVLDADVELTEMLGDNTNVYINAGKDQAILKVDSHDTPEVDSDLTFSIPMESVYLFDGETEEIIA